MDWALALAGLVFGAGGGAVVKTVITGRASAKKIGAEAAAVTGKIPFENDSLAVQNAEQSLNIMQGLNVTLVTENARLIKENDRLNGMISEKDAALERLSLQLESYRERVEIAESALRVANSKYTELRRDLDALRDHPGSQA